LNVLALVAKVTVVPRLLIVVTAVAAARMRLAIILPQRGLHIILLLFNKIRQTLVSMRPILMPILMPIQPHLVLFQLQAVPFQTKRFLAEDLVVPNFILPGDLVEQVVVLQVAKVVWALVEVVQVARMALAVLVV
jgi:hypothetical protein